MATTWDVGYNAAGTALDFPTIATANASGLTSDGDTLRQHYGDGNRSLRAAAGVVLSKAFTIETAIPDVVFMAGFLSAANKTCIFNDCKIRGDGSNQAVGVASGSTVICNRVVANAATGFICSQATGSMTCNACLAIGCTTGYTCTAGTMEVRQSTAAMCYRGVYRTGGTLDAYNTLGCICSSVAFGGTIGGSYNASDDGTGPATGLVSISSIDPKYLFSNTDIYYPLDFRPRIGSGLASAGVDCGVATDINGIAISGSFPIGCSNAISYIPEDKVLTTATPPGTFDEAARNTDPGAGNVLDGVTWLLQNVEQTGTLSISGSADAPTISAVTAGDGQLVVTVTPAAGYEALPIYVRHFDQAGTLSAESENRTGAGDVTLAGLTNGTLYGVFAYHKNVTVVGRPSLPSYAIPTDGENTPGGIIAEPLGVLQDMLAASTAWQTWTESASAAEAETHVHLEAVDGASAHQTPKDYTASLSALRPLAVIYTGDDWLATRAATGSEDHFARAGQLRLDLEAEIPAALRGKDELSGASVWFQTHAGAVIADLLAQSGATGKLWLSGVQLVEGPTRAHPDMVKDEGDWIMASFVVSWGIAG